VSEVFVRLVCFSFLDVVKRRVETDFYIGARELMYLSTCTYRSANMVIGGRRPISIVESSKDPISIHGQHFSANYLHYLDLINQRGEERIQDD
jgi:hypothetical protein